MEDIKIGDTVYIQFGYDQILLFRKYIVPEVLKNTFNAKTEEWYCKVHKKGVEIIKNNSKLHGYYAIKKSDTNYTTNIELAKAKCLKRSNKSFDADWVSKEDRETIEYYRKINPGHFL